MADDAPSKDPLAEILAAKAGNWNVRCRYFMTPNQPPIEADGTDTVEAMGSTWILARFRCSLMGSEIRGLATTGFDPFKKKFVGTWQDSSSPYFYYFEGRLEDGVLTMEGDNTDPMSGNLVKYRSVETLGEKQRKLELFIDPTEGDPIKILEYDFTRA